MQTAALAFSPATLIAMALASTGMAQAAPQSRLGSHLATAGPYGNYAIEGTEVEANGLTADHVLPSGFTTLLAATGNTSAETVFGWHDEGAGVVAASVSEQAAGWALNGALELGTMASAAGRSNVGPHDLVMRIRGPAHLRGKVELWAMGFVGPDASTSILVDVGADGTKDFEYIAGPTVIFARQQWDTDLGLAGALDILIRTEGHAVAGLGLQTTYFSGLTVRFTPGHFCAIDPYGSACGGHLVGYDTTTAGARTLVLELADSTPVAHGVLVIGSQPWSRPLPLSSCVLLTDPLLTLGFATDAAGAATHSLPLPLALTRADLRCQDIVIAARIAGSNGIVLACRP